MPPSPLQLNIDHATFHFTWDQLADRACVFTSQGEVWQGSLLPLLWVLDHEGKTQACKTTVVAERSHITSDGGTLAFDLGILGTGQLDYEQDADLGGLHFHTLVIEWNPNRPVPAINSLYFGADIMTRAQRRAAPTLELPFWPNWRGEGFGIPSAKTAPMQSFFRSWDFGQANIPLGSFGPAMGTPYAAAFPRPIYGGGVGGRAGWVFFGVGGPADGALTWQVRSCSGAIEWRCREDIWGAPPGNTRRWDHVLHLRWADTLWQAGRDSYRTFTPTPTLPIKVDHQKTFWGTWGDFKEGIYDLKASADRAASEMGADVLCIDDPWESTKGSCLPNRAILPNFEADLAYIRKRGLGLGIWMPTGWIGDPMAAGLDANDLLLNRDGDPIRANWALDPHEGDRAPCCLDPSSERTRVFLRERTQRVMRDYRPSLLKLDFGYGLPGPDGCAPRDPTLRGERLALTLAQIIATAAREIDPKVTLLGYSLHPLWSAVQDQLAMDDLGDSGITEAHGHRHWSVWAALAGDRGMAIMSSSGYDWAADAEVLLNTAVLGAPGANLPRRMANDTTVPTELIAHRGALMRWHRPARIWEPWWLNSKPGRIGVEPEVNTWGRLEHLPDGNRALTALALREPQPALSLEMHGLRWSGRWAVLSLTDADVFCTRELALVSFETGWIELPRAQKPRRVTCVEPDAETDHDDWTWQNGLLRIIYPASIPSCLGLKILTD